MGRIRSKLALTLSLAGALTLAPGAAQALAATEVEYNPSPDNTFFNIDDASGDDDVINVSLADNTITITDTGTGGIAPAPGETDCQAVNANTVTCPLDPPDPAPPAPPTAPVRFVQVLLDAGTDSFTNQNLPVRMNVFGGGATGNKTISSGPEGDFVGTGTGNDTIDTGTGDDGVSASSGDDSIVTGPGADFVSGNAGNDTVDTGAGRDSIEEGSFTNGADSLNGGPGASDLVDYFGENPVTMTLNGQADDGHAGEGDNILPGVEDLDAGEGNDVIGGDEVSNKLVAGDGDDQVTGAGGADVIEQGDGNDAVDGGEGNDTVDASGDEDGASGDEDGADFLAGGGGIGDLVDYCCGMDPVSINQNGQADDGRAGEGDNLSGFEGFEGGDGPDTIIADGSRNLISGNAGADLLVGNGGGDEFLAGAGDDTLISSGGSSIARGTALGRALAPRDDLQCDLSTGNEDQVGGGFIFRIARIERSAGPGFDTVAADARDRVDPDCERRGAEVASESARVNKKGKAKVRVACPQEEGAPCTGKLALLSNGKQVGKGKYKNIANGKKKNTKAKLSKKGRKALARSNGVLEVSAEARTREPPGITANAEDLLLTRKKGGGGKR